MFELIVGLEEIFKQRKIIVAEFQHEKVLTYKLQMTELDLIDRC